MCIRDSGEAAAYPGEPMIGFALTGLGAGSPPEGGGGEPAPGPSDGSDGSGGSGDEADALLRSNPMVDPETMDGETAARAAAATRRETLRRFGGAGAAASPPAEGETRERREALLRAAVRAGLDPMFPVIDYEPSEGEGLSGDEEDADIIERYDVTVPSEDADASPGEARR